MQEEYTVTKKKKKKKLCYSYPLRETQLALKKSKWNYRQKGNLQKKCSYHVSYILIWNVLDIPHSNFS